MICQCKAATAALHAMAAITKTTHQAAGYWTGFNYQNSLQLYTAAFTSVNSHCKNHSTMDWYSANTASASSTDMLTLHDTTR